MLSLLFNDHDYTVIYGGEALTLMPKEHELLYFLYRHRNQVFSRLDLLNAVWPMSDSYDRTVDDHIYRLRKKLHGWRGIQIETIRGRGYRLNLKEASSKKNPLQSDTHFQAGLDQLFQRFILYGQGKGVRSLMLHSDHINVGLDTSKRIYSQFIIGRFDALLHMDGISFWEKAFYLLYLYSIIQFDAKKALYFYSQAISRGQLPRRHQREIECYGMLRLLIDTGQWELTRRQIRELREENSNPLYLCNIEIYLMLSAGEEADEKILEGDALFHQFPYMREQGRFLLLKGLCTWYGGEIDRAKRLFSEGMDVLKNSEIVPSLIQGIHDILTLLPHSIDSDIRIQFIRHWDELAMQYGFEELTLKLERELSRHLSL